MGEAALDSFLLRHPDAAVLVRAKEQASARCRAVWPRPGGPGPWSFA
jgi:hypothetical protein